MLNSNQPPGLFVCLLAGLLKKLRTSLSDTDTDGWASGRASGLLRRVMTDEVLAWLSVWSEMQMICGGPADATATPIISCFVKIHSFGAGLPRLSWKRGH